MIVLSVTIICGLLVLLACFREHAHESVVDVLVLIALHHSLELVVTALRSVGTCELMTHRRPILQLS
jgi:hypothetical protein